MIKTGLIGITFALLANTATASLIKITGYDIANTNTSGTGGWAHTYSGTITGVSRNVAHYTGGQGTLNNGVVESTTRTTQLFNYTGETSPIITLYFDHYYTLSSLLISGGDFLANSIPGSLTGLDVTLGSVTQHFATIGQGIQLEDRFADDLVDFRGSALDGQITNQLSLSGFKSNWGSSNTFSIAEISLNGKLASVVLPEPHAIALFSLILLGIGVYRKTPFARSLGGKDRSWVGPPKR